MVKADHLPVFAAIKFHQGGTGFALPLLKHPENEQLRLIQEIDEQYDTVTGFRLLDGDTSAEILVRADVISYVGQPQIYVFLKDESVFAGTLHELEPVLRSFLASPLEHPAVSLQVAELMGTAQEKRGARTLMTRVIAERTGSVAAHSFFGGSILRTELWNHLVAAAPSTTAAKRILLARSRIDGRTNPDGTVTIDLSAIDPSDYNLTSLDLVQSDIASAFGEHGFSISSVASESQKDGRLLQTVTADVTDAVRERYGSGPDATQRREAILRSPVFSELVRLERVGDVVSLNNLIFRRNEFVELATIDPAGQILLSVINRIKKRLGGKSDQLKGDLKSVAATDWAESSIEAANPVVAALERASEGLSQRPRGSGRKGRPIESFKKQVDWICARLSSGDIDRAESALVELITEEDRAGRIDGIIRATVAAANAAREGGHLDWALALLQGLEVVGGPDVVVMSLRALTLLDLGRNEDALAVFDATIELFPNEEAAFIDRADALQRLDRHEEALQALDRAVADFPRSPTPLIARAELFRTLRLPDAALANYDDAVRGFPASEPALIGRVEVLRELGRSEEALAALEHLVQLFPNSERAKPMLLDLMFELGRGEQALALVGGLQEGDQFRLEVKFERFHWDTVVDEAWKDCLDWRSRFNPTFARNKFVLLRNSALRSLETIGDRKLIRAIVSNLLRNAIQASLPRFAGRRPLEIRILAQPQSEMDIVQVTNWGIGITADQQELVFRPFFRSQGAHRLIPDRGMGLGLYVCRLYAHAHSGEIFCRQSRPTLDDPRRTGQLEGFETTFELRIPKNLPIGDKLVSFAKDSD